MTTFQIRLLRDTDSFADLTALLHRAYAPLAAAGMRFYASHQSEADTRSRATVGECFVVEQAGALIATITLRGPARKDEPAGAAAHYNRQDVYTFGQLGVDPSFAGQGIGRQLLDLVEARARELGAVEIACDTSERADALLSLYARRGYRVVETVQWEVTNYRSVILSKRL